MSHITPDVDMSNLTTPPQHLFDKLVMAGYQGLNSNCSSLKKILKKSLKNMSTCFVLLLVHATGGSSPQMRMDVKA